MEPERLILIFGGLLMIGFTISIIVHARYLVHAVTAWRLFLTGKSLLTVFVCASLWSHRHSASVSWRLPLVGFAMLLTLVSLVMLTREYRRRQADEHERKETR
jgi:H+/Cl- antiporter ClcA